MSMDDKAKADEDKRSQELTAQRAKDNAVYARGEQPEHHLAKEGAAFVPTNVDQWMGNQAMEVVKDHWTDPGNPGSGIDAHIRSQKELEEKEQDRGSTQGAEGREGRQGAGRDAGASRRP
jgi:hypothetical protein